jgi:PAS domain S-box-containing protein
MRKVNEDVYRSTLKQEKGSKHKSDKVRNDKALELHKLNEQLQKTNEKLEDRLNEKTSELRGVFENIIDAYVVTNVKGDVIRMNNAAVELLGYDIKKESFNLMSLVHKEDIEYTAGAFKELFKNGFYTNYKARIFTKSRKPILVHVNSSIIYNTEGKPVAAHGIVRDITKETINAEIFEEQKRELDIIIDNSPLGIFLTINGYIIKSNNAFQELLGYESRELLHKNIGDFAVSESIPVISDEFYGTYIESPNLNSKIETYQKKDGSLLIGRTIINAVMDKEGNEKYQVGMIEDITNQIKESSTLKVLNNIMASILGKVDLTEITWIIAKNTMNLFGFEDCLIYTFDENREYLIPTAYGIKKPKKKGYSPKMKIKVGRGVVGAVAKTGKAEIITDTSKDSRYIPDEIRNFSEITVPIISEGKVIGIIDSEHSSKNYFTQSHLQTLVSIANLTAAKLRHVLNLNLRKKAEQQRAELLKQLERNNEQLKEFAHIVSHDLKSPLRSISALASWMQEDYGDVIDENGRNNLTMMQDKIQKMDHLIDGILRYSSVQNSKHITEEVAVEKVIKDILETIYIPPNVTIEIQNELPVIQADAIRMQQLFQNLISNAVTYCDKKVGKVEIGFQSKKKFWKFWIRDNGIGIPEEYHKKIFMVFQSLGNHENSTGIGLSIVKKIVDQYDGRVWLESTLNEGTTFYFTIKK